MQQEQLLRKDVVGGGCALRASHEFDKVKVKGDDQKAGVEIVKSALQAPIDKLLLMQELMVQ